MNLEEFNTKRKDHLTMIDVAKAVLEKNEDIMHFNDILATVSDYLEYSDEEIDLYMTQFYTDLNTEGSFISLGDNVWGLRAWYAIDAINEEVSDRNALDTLVPAIADDGFDAYTTEEDEMDDPQVDFEEEEDDDDTVMEKKDGLEELGEYEDDLSELNIVDEDELEDDDSIEEEYDED